MKKSMPLKGRGFTLIEVAITVTIMAILAVVAAAILVGKKNSNDLSNTVSSVTALLQEAESRSVTQVQGASWGIHFSNATTTTPFYALFFSYYSPTTTVGYYRLPSDVTYVPSTVPIGSSLDVMFAQVSGISSASTTVGFYNASQPSIASGVNITLSGGISPGSISVNAATISSISPNATTTGVASFTLFVTGTLYTSSSIVEWGGAQLATTFISSSSLTAVVPSTDVMTAGTVNVIVWSADNGSSNSQTFTVDNPVPTLTSISPTSATAGGSVFVLTANGTNFANSGESTIYWNGSPLTTTYVSATQATTTVPVADILSGGTISVTVLNSGPGGGASGGQDFTVNDPVPTLTSISPTSATADGSGFVLTVVGTNFAGNSTVNWNGSALATTYVSAAGITGVVPSADIASAGTATITVTNPAPGGGTTSGQTFTITSGGSSFNGYTYERSITVTADISIASGTQSNFPMLVSSTLASWEPVSQGGYIQNVCTAPNGGREPCDLVFTSDSGCSSPLNFETESYSSSTGAVVDWVNVPTMAAGATIYACYGNSSIMSDQSHPSLTWNSNYLNVYHFTANATNLGLNDSTANGFLLTNHGGVTASSTGFIGTAANFNGASYLENVSASIPLSNPATTYATSTISFWMNSPFTGATTQSAFAYVDATSRLQAHVPWSGTLYWDDGDVGSNRLTASLPTTYANTWTYITLVGGGNAGSYQAIYINGVLASSQTKAGGAGNNATDLQIGDFGSNSYDFAGLIEEFRVADVVQTPSWILTEYNNQSSPATFYTMGSQVGGGGEQSGADPNIRNPIFYNNRCDHNDRACWREFHQFLYGELELEFF